jgi:hypothetical protein
MRQVKQPNANKRYARNFFDGKAEPKVGFLYGESSG